MFKRKHKNPNSSEENAPILKFSRDYIATESWTDFFDRLFQKLFKKIQVEQSTLKQRKLTKNDLLRARGYCSRYPTWQAGHIKNDNKIGIWSGDGKLGLYLQYEACRNLEELSTCVPSSTSNWNGIYPSWRASNTDWILEPGVKPATFENARDLRDTSAFSLEYLRTQRVRHLRRKNTDHTNCYPKGYKKRNTCLYKFKADQHLRENSINNYATRNIKSNMNARTALQHCESRMISKERLEYYKQRQVFFEWIEQLEGLWTAIFTLCLAFVVTTLCLGTWILIKRLWQNVSSLTSDVQNNNETFYQKIQRWYSQKKTNDETFFELKQLLIEEQKNWSKLSISDNRLLQKSTNWTLNKINLIETQQWEFILLSMCGIIISFFTFAYFFPDFTQWLLLPKFVRDDNSYKPFELNQYVDLLSEYPLPKPKNMFIQVVSKTVPMFDKMLI